MKKCLILLSILVAGLTGFTQEQFNKAYPEHYSLYGLSVFTTVDTGYVLIGNGRLEDNDNRLSLNINYTTVR